MTTLYRVSPAEFEFVRSGDGRTLHGLAVPFDVPAQVSDGGATYTEMFRRGSFARTIRERGDRVKLLVAHDGRTRLPIGRATNLVEDAAGLLGEFRVSKTALGDEVLELVRDQALDSLSIGFVPKDHDRLPNGTVVRTEVRLNEVSVVSTPAYAQALIAGIRSQRSLSREHAGRRLAILERRFQ